jgi:hypothetical protein
MHVSLLVYFTGQQCEGRANFSNQAWDKLKEAGRSVQNEDSTIRYGAACSKKASGSENETI